MELREVIAALRASWWMLLLGLLLGAALLVSLSLAQTPLYTSQTQMFVSTTDSASTAEVFQGSQFSQQRVTSYAKLLTGNELARRVADELGVENDPAELADQISANVVPDTVLIDVSATDPSAEHARDIAAAIGRVFPAFVSELEAMDADGESPVRVAVTEPAQVATAPSAPSTVRNTAFGALVGLVLGGALAIARVRLDRSVKSQDEAAELAGAPVIGTVLRDEALEKRHLIDRTSTNRVAEDYRQLRTNLQFLRVDEPPRVLMVSSALPAEGKTTVVVNLALTLVDAGHTVTILEADLRRPKVTRYLGLIGGVGLTNLLAGTAEIEEVSQTYREGLSVIAAGPTPPNPGELLASSQMASVVEKIRSRADYVLIDAPPLLPVADSSGLAAQADGVLLSVRYGSTRRDQLRQAASNLERVGASILGVILNIVPPKADVAVAYGYGYSYDAEPSRAGRKGRV